MPKTNKAVSEQTINIAPNYRMLFKFAETLVKANLTKGQGQDFVLEVLKHGGELVEQNIKLEKELIDGWKKLEEIEDIQARLKNTGI